MSAARSATVALMLGFAGFGVVAAVPAGAQADGESGSDGSGDTGAQLAPPTATTLLPVLDQITGSSIAAGIADPETPVAPPDTVIGLGADGHSGNAQVSTRFAEGELNSNVVVNAGETRGVVTVKAVICPGADGKVSYPITLSIVGAKKHEITARAEGAANDSANLVGAKVDTGTAKGGEAALLHNFGMQLLKNGESAWRGGYCVKIDVSEGQSRAVQLKERVPISAIASPRFGGSPIKGRMESKKTSGSKKVEPGAASGSPAKFTYTAPDKRRQTGSVKLTSVSKRGIGTAELHYTTELDLKVDAVIGTAAHFTGTKCGGPAGTWELTYTSAAFQGEGHITVVLGEDGLSGTYSGTGFAASGRVQNLPGGTATYTASADGKSGSLVLSQGGTLPVIGGEFCKE